MSKASLLALFESVPLSHSEIDADYDSDCSKLYDYYRGRQRKRIQPILAKAYPNAVAGGMRALAFPFVTRLIDATATLFHRPPIWDLLRDGEPLPIDSADAKTWAEIDEETRLNSRLKLSQRTARRDKTVFLGPAWRNRSLKIDVFRPNQVFVLADAHDSTDLDAARAVVTTSGSGWMLWTSDECAYIERDEDGEYQISDPLQTGYVNPYGEIPLVVLHDQPGDDLFAPLDDSLTTGQEALCQLWSANVWAMGQGFAINVLYTDDTETKGAELVGGPDRVIVIPSSGGSAKMERLAAALDPGGMIDFAAALLKTYAVLQAADPGIFSVDTEVFANALSGIAKQVDRMDLNALREDSEADWEYGLKRLFAKIVKVWNYHVPSARRLSTDLSLGVTWREPQPEGNSLQDAQAERMRIEDGTETPASVKAKRDGISEQEAEAAVNG